MSEEAIVAALNAINNQIADFRNDIRSDITDIFVRLRNVELYQAVEGGKKKGSADVYARVGLMITIALNILTALIYSGKIHI